MAQLYKPQTSVTTCEVPYLALVIQADPAWARRKYWDVEYEFDQRVMMANPYQRGAYNRLSNDYAVGQQYGSLDPLIQEALAPTVGNSVPGLYEGVDDGMGWA